MCHNLSQIKPIHIDTILGYEIYVPDSYFNPYGLRKAGCPLWVKIDDDGNSLVHILSSSERWLDEITDVISSLPKRHGVAYYPLTEDVIKQYGINTQDPFSLGSVAKDENGIIQAIMAIDKDGEDNSMMVSFVYYTDILVLQELRNHILADYNTDRFKGTMLKYYPTSKENLTQVLGLLCDDEHDYSYLQLL